MTKKTSIKVICPKTPQLQYIRKLRTTKEDFEALARCFNTFNDPESWPGGFGGSFVFTGEWIEENYKDQDLSNYFVAVAPDDKNKIVGLCFINKSFILPDAWYVALLGVDPSYQGKGFGKALLLKATELAVEKNARFISLHTWGGNLKAMPLYKRQGYKWRPKTSVYMENYIPQILNYPLFQEFFQKYCWYDIFKPKITQEVDEEFLNGMEIYEYFFHADENNFLKVWIDRSVGLISGFELNIESEKLSIKALTPKSEGFISVEKFPIHIKIANMEQKEKKFNLRRSTAKEIKIVHAPQETVITLVANQKKEITAEASILPNAEALDTQKYPEAYTPAKITFNIEYNGMKIPLTIGKIPKKTIEIETIPQPFHSKTDCTIQIPLQISNYFDKDLDIKLELQGTSDVLLTESKKELTLRKPGETITIPAKIAKTESKTDYILVKAFNDKEQLLLEKKIPILIFAKPRALFAEINNTLYIENEDISVKIDKNPIVDENAVIIEDKHHNITTFGLWPYIGYPFDEEGSEFYSKPLRHIIIQQDDGIIVESSGISTIKRGLKIVRRIKIPNFGKKIMAQFKIINETEKTFENIGTLTRLRLKWSVPMENFIMPLRKGIFKTNMHEYTPTLGTDPSRFNEGWIAFQIKKNLFVGYLFDYNSYKTIKAEEHRIWLETHTDTLKKNQIHASPEFWVVFAGDWHEIQQEWMKHFNYKDLYSYQSIFAENMIKVGVTKSEKDNIVSGLLLDKQHDHMMVAIDVFRKNSFKGTMTLKFDDLPIEPTKINFECHKKRHFHEKIMIKAKNTKKKIHVGYLTLDTGTKIYNHIIGLATYDSTRNVSIKKVKENNRAFQEINNGFLVFKADNTFAARVFHLSTIDEPEKNYLSTFYPEVKPFLWFNKYYGGIGPFLRTKNTWNYQDFLKLTYLEKIIQKGLWRGISFETSGFEYDTQLNGLKLITNYLTLPETPVLLIQIELVNTSRMWRECVLEVSASLNTSKTINDVFYLGDLDENILNVFHSQNYQFYHTLSTKNAFVSHQKSGNKYQIGAVILTKMLTAKIYLQNFNFMGVNLGLDETLIKIPPNGTKAIEILFILAKNYREIGAFSSNNYNTLFSL